MLAPRSVNRPGSSRPRSPTIVDVASDGGVAQALRLRERLQAAQGGVLDLADALAGHAEGAAHLLERARRLPVQAEAHLDHAALALRQGVERVLDVLAAQARG